MMIGKRMVDNLTEGFKANKIAEQDKEASKVRAAQVKGVPQLVMFTNEGLPPFHTSLLYLSLPETYSNN